MQFLNKNSSFNKKNILELANNFNLGSISEEHLQWKPKSSVNASSGIVFQACKNHQKKGSKVIENGEKLSKMVKKLWKNVKSYPKL